uniref:C-type lectin domain-containing protein n=1 Tax=Acrobeloides nanus TaxID=290746 RepID=A0A914EFK5_9BILA
MPNDWASAEEMCSNYNNGHLTSVADIFDNSFIHNEIQILDYKAVEGYYATKSDWSSSETYCANNSGHLASIHSYQEDNFVRNLFSSNYDPWIGLHYVNNQWIYTDGTAYDYSPANSLPKNYTYYPCADIHQAGYFNNVGCNEFSLTSVCKVAPLSNKKI